LSHFIPITADVQIMQTKSDEIPDHNFLRKNHSKGKATL